MERLNLRGPEFRALFVLVFCAFVLIMGVGFGAAAATGLPVDHRAGIASQVARSAVGSSQAPDALFMRALTSQLRTGLLLFVAGLTVIGSPAVLAVLFGRGFVSGFAAGLLVREFGGRGMLLALTSLFPAAVFWIPATIGLASASLTWAVTAATGLGERKTVLAGRYAFVSCCFVLMLCLAAMVEAFLCPVFLRLTLPLLAH